MTLTNTQDLTSSSCIQDDQNYGWYCPDDFIANKIDVELDTSNIGTYENPDICGVVVLQPPCKRTQNQTLQQAAQSSSFNSFLTYTIGSTITLELPSDELSQSCIETHATLSFTGNVDFATIEFDQSNLPYLQLESYDLSLSGYQQLVIEY